MKNHLIFICTTLVLLASSQSVDISSMPPSEAIPILNGNPVECYEDIQGFLKLLDSFQEVGSSYVSNPLNPESVTSNLNTLVDQSEDLRSSCGVALGPISYRTTQYMQQYCVSNIEDLMRVSTQITGEPPLTTSIAALNVFFNEISYAVNTCGGIQDTSY